MPISPLQKKYLGEILLQAGLIDRVQLRDALAEQQSTKEKLGDILLQRGYISEADLQRGLALSYGIPAVKLSELTIPKDVICLISPQTAKKYKVIPVSHNGESLQLAISDPSNMLALDEVEAETNLKISTALSSEADITSALERYYAGAIIGATETAAEAAAVENIKKTDTDSELSDDDLEAAETAPIIKYVNALFQDAINKGASDIHIEPGENCVFLRMRVDGALRELTPPPYKYLSPIVSRVKIMSSLDIAERRLPQDGKCKMKIGEKRIDVRVSTLPTIYGEKVVLRILDRAGISLKMSDIGLTPQDTEVFQEILNSPHGMILLTGPTGSGKTTTLYTGLSFINTTDRNIVTVEDPVEYELKSVNQVQVRSNIGLTFANVLRSVLRQDPDVIMVGEIRDKETAEIAIQSALTGHLVLSTLHTNDAVSSLARLRYMGIEPFLIADAVELIIAQRLVRKICPHCKEPIEVPERVLERLGYPKGEKITVYHGKGCDKCFGSGYKGRTAINEVLRMSNRLRKMMLSDAGDVEMKQVAIEEGMRTLRDQAISKLMQGITTIEEVLTITTTF